MGILSTKTQEEYFAQFERMGEDGVRLYLQHAPALPFFFSPSDKMRRFYAVKWLSRFDHKARLRTEACQAESLVTAKSAKDAAWVAAEAAREAADEAKKANVIATVALTVAVIAIAVSVLALFLRD